MFLSREPRCGPPGKMQSEQSGVPTRVQTSSKGSRLPFLDTTGNSASEYPSIPFAPDLNNLIYHRRHFRIIKQSCSFPRNGRKHDLSRVYISHRRQVLSIIITPPNHNSFSIPPCPVPPKLHQAYPSQHNGTHNPHRRRNRQHWQKGRRNPSFAHQEHKVACQPPHPLPHPLSIQRRCQEACTTPRR